MCSITLAGAVGSRRSAQKDSKLAPFGREEILSCRSCTRGLLLSEVKIIAIYGDGQELG